MILVELDATCHPCRIGLHNECSAGFQLALAEDQVCCCEGEYDIRLHLKQVRQADKLLLGGDIEEQATKGSRGREQTEVQAPARGDSGYIHPDAWPSSQDIGTLTNPESTGRKRVERMFPLTAGQQCEFARLKTASGGMPVAIIGCMGNPATDLHHGPDKNTLNNQKVSRGVGVVENVWALCSFCHNALHVANDEFYPAYDRIAQQAQPWLPNFPGEWAIHDPVTEATVEELVEVAARREQDRRRRGRNTKGRNSAPRSEPELGIQADDD